jgi:hypothetical protein
VTALLADLFVVVARRRYPALRLVPGPVLRLAVRPRARRVARRASAWATVLALVAAGVVTG